MNVNMNTLNRVDKHTYLNIKAASSAALCGTARTERYNKPNLYACRKSRWNNNYSARIDGGGTPLRVPRR